jgi:hypothetical protein
MRLSAGCDAATTRLAITLHHRKFATTPSQTHDPILIPSKQGVHTAPHFARIHSLLNYRNFTMKVRNLTAAIVFASVAALAGPASALTTTGNLMQDVHSSLTGDGTITATVSGDTVTLIGNANAVDKAAAERVAQSYPNVDRVINLVSNQS